MTVRPAYPIEPAVPSPDQTVFVRTFTTPPGLPWDQSRMARLEARSGAPLPLAEVLYQLRRLDPWRAGRAARYAAFYVHAQGGQADVETVAEVLGKSMRVRFSSPRDQARRVWSLALLAASTGVFAAALSAAVFAALDIRTETTNRLDAVAKIASAKLRSAQGAERNHLDGQSLDAAGVKGISLAEALSDLAWVSSAKTPDARVEAFHWDHGQIALEVRGDAEPLPPGFGSMVRASKPIRPRVWLWGLERKPSRTPTP
jgi:hypothetical protein